MEAFFPDEVDMGYHKTKIGHLLITEIIYCLQYTLHHEDAIEMNEEKEKKNIQKSGRECYSVK